MANKINKSILLMSAKWYQRKFKKQLNNSKNEIVKK